MRYFADGEHVAIDIAQQRLTGPAHRHLIEQAGDRAGGAHPQLLRFTRYLLRMATAAVPGAPYNWASATCGLLGT